MEHTDGKEDEDGIVLQGDWLTSQRLGTSFTFTLGKVQKNFNLQEAAATQSFLKQTNKKNKTNP